MRPLAVRGIETRGRACAHLAGRMTVPLALVLRTLLPALLLPLAASSQEAAPTVCFFGDSIMEGWIEAELHAELAYPHVVDSAMLARQSPIRSLIVAHAGETTRDAILRMDRDVLASRPAAVVIAFGSNDYYIHGYATEPRVSLGEFRRNLRIMVEKCLGIGVIPVLLGLPPNLQIRYYEYSAERLYAPYGGATALNRAYDETIRETALIANIPYVDVRRIYEGNEANLLGFDGVHPLPEGHRRIAAVLGDTLRRSLQKPSIPIEYASVTVYPKPFSIDEHRFEVFAFGVSEAGNIAVEIFDLGGRRIWIHSNPSAPAGKALVVWDGRAADGTRASAGVYIAAIQSRARRSFQTVIIQ